MSRSVFVILAVGALLGATFPGVSAADGMEPPDRVVESAVLDPGDEPLMDLVYEWTQGQVQPFVFEMWDARTSYLDDFAMEEQSPIPFRVEATLTVERVESDGTATTEIVIDGIELSEPGLSAEASELLSDLQTIVGVRVREELDDKGYVIAAQVIDPVEDDDGLHPTRAMAAGIIVEMATRLPLEPIGIGGTWQEVVTTTDDGLVKGTETHTKRLTGVGLDDELQLEASSVVAIPEQGMAGDDFGLEEDVTASGDGRTAASVIVDRSSVIPVWEAVREGVLDLDIPIGDGVTVRQELTSGIVGAPPDWDGSTWPQLPAVPDGLGAAPDSGDEPRLPLPPGAIDVVVHDPGEEPRQVLRYDLKEGQVEHNVVVMRMGMRMATEGEWTPWLGLPSTEMAATTTVSEVRDDGTYLVDVVYTDMGVPDGSAQVPPEALEEMEAQLASLIGMRQTVHLDDRGRVLEAHTEMPPGASLEGMQPGQLDAMSRDLIDPLPAEPVGAGAVWEVTKVPSDVMGFATHGSNTLELVEVSADGQLRIEGEMSLSADPGPMTIPGMEYVDASVERFETTGSFLKSVDLGMLNPEARSEGLTDYAFTVTFGETSESTEMQMSMEMDAWLLDAPGE